MLDGPETSRSQQRQVALLCLLDDLHQDGRARAPVATHPPVPLAHPGADLLWIGGNGSTRRPLADIPHCCDMRRFMTDPAAAPERMLA